MIGFPPPDEELRDWLLSFRYKNLSVVAKELHHVIYALLNVTLRRLECIQEDHPCV